MRVRTLLAFGAGVMVGAGASYLGDPEHGRQRRGEARSWAVARGRERVGTTAGAAARSARSWVSAAAEGYREAGPAAR